VDHIKHNICRGATWCSLAVCDCLNSKNKLKNEEKLQVKKYHCKFCNRIKADIQGYNAISQQTNHV
jgi:hypothetical protein